MSNENKNTATGQDDWESGNGSGNTWNPKQNADKIPYAPADRVYDATKQPDHAEKDILIGHWIDKREGIGQYNSDVITVVSQKDGKKYDVWLDTVLGKELEKVPSMNILVRLEWLGTKLKDKMKEGQKGATFNAWDVKWKSSDTYKGQGAKPVTSTNVASSEEKPADQPTAESKVSETPKTKAPAATTAKKTEKVEDVDTGDNDDLPF